MALIATLIASRGVTRILFDCRDATPAPDDEQRIAATIVEAGEVSPDRLGEMDQAASAFSTNLPFTLPSRNRISAS